MNKNLKNIKVKRGYTGFLVYSTLTNFTQRKRKTYDANDLSAFSLVIIIFYIYSLGKKFFVYI